MLYVALSLSDRSIVVVAESDMEGSKDEDVVSDREAVSV